MFYLHPRYDANEMVSIAKFVKWYGLDGNLNDFAYPLCRGTYRHGICVMSIHDLPWMTNIPQLFANKFLGSVDPFATVCLSEYLKQKVKNENKLDTL